MLTLDKCNSYLHTDVFNSRVYQIRDSKKINWSDRMLQKFHLPNIFKDEVPNQPDDYFTCEFQAAKLDK